MTLYQDASLLTVHVDGVRLDGDWLVFSTTSGEGELHLRLDQVVAYRRSNGSTLHVFTTGTGFALVAAQGGPTLGRAVQYLLRLPRTGP